MPKQLTRHLVILRLAAIERAVARLRFDYEQATYRQNELVDECVDCAEDECKQALKSLVREDVKRAAQHLSIAYLYQNFGRQLLDAEAVEHILGESDYLELTSTEHSWQALVEREFGWLEQKLLVLRAEIKNLLEVPSESG